MTLEFNLELAGRPFVVEMCRHAAVSHDPFSPCHFGRDEVLFVRLARQRGEPFVVMVVVAARHVGPHTVVPTVVGAASPQ